MNPHPTTIALDIAALFGFVCAIIVVLWAILGAWHWWTYRRFFKRDAEARADADRRLAEGDRLADAVALYIGKVEDGEDEPGDLCILAQAQQAALAGGCVNETLPRPRKAL